MVELNKLDYQDKLKIKDMEEGKTYPITQGGNGYSDGVMVTKNGDELRLRHFWEEDWVEEEGNEDGAYFKENGLYYPTDMDWDQTDVIHKDILQILPDAIEYTFEEMTLIEFYEVVVMGLYYERNEEGFVVPNHLKGKCITYNREGKKLHGLD